MSYFTIIVAAICQFGEPITVEADQYEPVVISVDLELAEGETQGSFWRSDGKAKFREIDGGKSLAVWAPPGKHKIWRGAVIVSQNPFAIRTVEFSYEILIRGPPVPEPSPDDPEPEPSPDFPKGAVSAVVLRDLDTQTPDQAEWLIKSQVELSKAGTQLTILEHDQPGIPAGYSKRFEADSLTYPAFFVVVETGEKDHIVATGEVTSEKKIAATIASVKARQE